MKRYVLCILAIMLMLTACGGGGEEQSLSTTAPTLARPQAQTTVPESTSAGVTLEEQVIYDSGGVTVTVTGLSDDWMGTKVNLLVENSTQRNLVLSADVFGVNGVTVPGYLYAEVAAGMKTNDSLELYTDALNTAGITRIATIRSNDARLVDTDSYEVIASVPLALDTSVADGYQQEIDGSGEELFNQDGVTVMARIVSEEMYGRAVQLLVKNETGKDIIVEAENVSVNGYTLDAWLYDKVLADTVRFCELDLFSTGLEENGIEQIQQVSFRLRVLNAENLQTVTESEKLDLFVQG